MARTLYTLIGNIIKVRKNLVGTERTLLQCYGNEIVTTYLAIELVVLSVLHTFFATY